MPTFTPLEVQPTEPAFNIIRCARPVCDSDDDTSDSESSSHTSEEEKTWDKTRKPKGYADLNQVTRQLAGLFLPINCAPKTQSHAATRTTVTPQETKPSKPIAQRCAPGALFKTIVPPTNLTKHFIGSAFSQRSSQIAANPTTSGSIVTPGTAAFGSAFLKHDMKASSPASKNRSNKLITPTSPLKPAFLKTFSNIIENFVSKPKTRHAGHKRRLNGDIPSAKRSRHAAQDAKISRPTKPGVWQQHRHHRPKT